MGRQYFLGIEEKEFKYLYLKDLLGQGNFDKLIPKIFDTYKKNGNRNYIINTIKKGVHSDINRLVSTILSLEDNSLKKFKKT